MYFMCFLVMILSTCSSILLGNFLISAVHGLFILCCAFHGCLLNVQANWYIEWHFDVLIVWTLAKVGEISKAEDLLKGLKNRWKCYILPK